MIAPTIIIGVGGIGSDICCKVSQLVRDDEQRKRLRFVCIDTDINDLRQRQAADPRIITIQTSAPYTVGSYLEVNTVAREKWFPVHNILNGKTPTEGAGQVRAISRLAFDTAVREGKMQDLEQAVEELYYLDGAADPQAVRVMVVSTLVGGTGSGIVLPVAMYVRHFLETRFRKSASVIRGFFLLPEIFYAGKSPEERGSLACNAYAAVRELDAFTRRGDGALTGHKYDGLELIMPDSTTSSYVDYKVSPFNFCFLYDKRNTDDMQLRSVADYKEHAANTIYTQTMSGISSRSNSNEDNAIKSLVSSNGRNRFCGAGSSLLKYPRDDVLCYVANHWAQENMGVEWLEIDRQFEDEMRDYKIRKKANPSEVRPERSDFYIQVVEDAEKGSFAYRLKEMTHQQVENDDVQGGIDFTSKAVLYFRALNEYIFQQIKNNTDLEGARGNADAIVAELEELAGKSKRSVTGDKIDAADASVTLYAAQARQIANRVGRSLALQLFGTDTDYTSDTKSKHHMEFFMKDGDGNFIHPNASRYFIYKLYKLMKKSLESMQSEGSGLEQKERILYAPYDDPSTEEKETLEDLKKNAKIGKFTSDPEEAIDAIKANRDGVEGTLQNPGLAALTAQKAVYTAGLEFLRKLAAAFETFYQNFDTYLRGSREEIAEIRRRYVNGEGKATRYVCASTTCLDKMLEEMPCEADGINGQLSACVYQSMKAFALMTKAPNASIHFKDLYDNTIMGYWCKTVDNLHAARINMDILSALEAEAEYESEYSLEADQKSRYVARILEQAERLAAPFIEEPMGEIRHTFEICAYNPVVAGEADSSRRTFVNQYLNGALSGQQDSDVSPYELMIYRAVYNLAAGDLKRFRAPEGNDTQGGSYYASYIETINQLGPHTGENKVLTPHLDRHWHLAKYMPDLDDRNQDILERRIYTALCWGMLTGMIRQKTKAHGIDGSVSIRYSPTSSAREIEKFVVPNGTPCDEIYEVVDALEINPPQVTAILTDLENTMAKEYTSKLELEETRLINCMNWQDRASALGSLEGAVERDDVTAFTIRQYAPDQKASMLDLLYWVKYSTPANVFDNSTVENMLESMMLLLERYVSRFEEDTDRMHERCYKMLVDQFNLFVANLQDEKVTRPAAAKRLSDSVVENIAIQIDERIANNYGLDARFDGTMMRILDAVATK